MAIASFFNVFLPISNFFLANGDLEIELQEKQATGVSKLTRQVAQIQEFGRFLVVAESGETQALVLDHVLFGFQANAERVLEISELLCSRSLSLLCLRRSLFLRLLLCCSALATTTNCPRSSSPSSTFTGIVIGDFTNQCASSGTTNCAARARTCARLLRGLLLCLSLLLIRLFLLYKVERVCPRIADCPFVARRLILRLLCGILTFGRKYEYIHRCPQ
jgi:hypothetical protein